MSVFVEKIRQACLNSRSLLCVGLDPDPDLMPVPDVFEFNEGEGIFSENRKAPELRRRALASDAGNGNNGCADGQTGTVEP